MINLPSVSNAIREDASVIIPTQVPSKIEVILGANGEGLCAGEPRPDIPDTLWVDCLLLEVPDTAGRLGIGGAILLLKASRLDTELDMDRPSGRDGGVVAPVDDAGEWAKPPTTLEPASVLESEEAFLSGRKFMNEALFLAKKEGAIIICAYSEEEEQLNGD